MPRGGVTKHTCAHYCPLHITHFTSRVRLHKAHRIVSSALGRECLVLGPSSGEVLPAFATLCPVRGGACSDRCSACPLSSAGRERRRGRRAACRRRLSRKSGAALLLGFRPAPPRGASVCIHMMYALHTNIIPDMHSSYTHAIRVIHDPHRKHTAHPRPPRPPAHLHVLGLHVLHDGDERVQRRAAAPPRAADAPQRRRQLHVRTYTHINTENAEGRGVACRLYIDICI